MWRIEKQRGDLFRLCCAQVNPTIDQRRCILIFVIRQIFLCPQRGAQLVNFNQWLMDCRRFWMPIDEPRIDHPRTPPPSSRGILTTLSNLFLCRGGKWQWSSDSSLKRHSTVFLYFFSCNSSRNAVTKLFLYPPTRAFLLHDSS